MKTSVTVALSVYTLLAEWDTCLSFTTTFGKRRSRHSRVLDVAFSSPDAAATLGRNSRISSSWSVSSLSASLETSAGSFIDTELRGAAMKLHTRSQSPKEGQVEDKKMEPYVTTQSDYLAFLVDSQHVYKAFEDVINSSDQLSVFRNTGLERVVPLETDIEFMVKEFGLVKPNVGEAGMEYAKVIRELGSDGATPELLCHYYNYYFAHTAGGRMIGKQMSALLLNKKTLEFYKWDGDLNEIKARVKSDIETMVSSWSDDQKRQCVDATGAAFKGGGSLNRCLSGGQSSH